MKNSTGKFILSQQPCLIEYKILGKGKPLHLISHSSFFPENEYADRQIGAFDGEKTFTMPLPFAPDALTWGLYGEDFELLAEPTVVLASEKRIFEKQITDFDAKLQEFLYFVRYFCQKASDLDCGHFESENKNFTLEYTELVQDKQGNILSTPARVNRDWGRVYVAKEYFKEITVPARLFILLHEFAHHYLGTPNEFLADKFASEVYLQLGGSKYEGVAVLAKMFWDRSNSEQLARYNAQLALMNQYNYNL